MELRASKPSPIAKVSLLEIEGEATAIGKAQRIHKIRRALTSICHETMAAAELYMRSFG
jgi:hypothetical protein